MVKKTRLPISIGNIQKTDVKNELLTFSFKHFINHDSLSPEEHPVGYTQMLMERLRDLSLWRVSEFTQRCDGGVRNHRITWSKTAHPAGFNHIPEQVRAGEEWQFALSRRNGRVHGLLIGSVFHIVWLDCHHQLYPGT